jgi:hypothetical protein
MTIRLHDNQGRDWTVEGDWSGQVVGADFDGRGKILIWISRDDEDAHLELVESASLRKAIAALAESEADKLSQLEPGPY